MAKKSEKIQQSSEKVMFQGFRWVLFIVVLVVAVIGIIFYFQNDIAEATFEVFGLGIVLVGLWILAITTVAWMHRLQTMPRFWNTWLSAGIFSAAVMGVMGLLEPEMSIAGVEISEVSLSGSIGQAIVGSSWEWARLTCLFLVSIILFAPRESVKATQQVSTSTWEWTKPWIVTFLVELSAMAQESLLWIYNHIVLMFTGFIGWFKEDNRKTESKPEKKIKPKPVVYKVSNEVKATKPIKESTVEQMTLPGLDGELPPIDLLDEAPKAEFAQADDDERARLIEEALASYGVEVTVKQINPGPSVTQFGIEPGWVRKYKKVSERDQDGKPVLDKEGNPKYHMEESSRTRVKVERITSLANDLALGLAVSDIRIEAPMPGTSLVGIEVPNTSTAIVSLRGILESQSYKKLATKTKLATALGLGPGGEPIAGDIAKMPHLLIAGATGSGKSVCLNCIVSCVLAQTSPHDVRLVLIDPKRVEMVNFKDIPHLITPVIVDSDKAVETLKRITMEMDNRYHQFADVGARNIEAYNRNSKVTQQMPYIVVVIDELADLMMTSADVVEPLICRLAQLARATGIHLVVATQRPSVDVITGLIKANFPTRISFAVVSSVDSRTILDTVGAEKLLGKGDMLYIPPEASKPKRIRGCFVSDEEIGRLVAWWKEWAVRYLPPEADLIAREFEDLSVVSSEIDPFLEKAKVIVEESGSVSTSLLQRKLHIGYQRAARIMEQLETEGFLENGETASPWEGEP